MHKNTASPWRETTGLDETDNNVSWEENESCSRFNKPQSTETGLQSGYLIAQTINHWNKQLSSDNDLATGARASVLGLPV